MLSTLSEHFQLAQVRLNSMKRFDKINFPFLQYIYIYFKENLALLLNIWSKNWKIRTRNNCLLNTLFINYIAVLILIYSILTP